MDFLDVVILSAVEGITEFLPISSTGHLILTSHILGLEQNDFMKSFEIAIQLGSILAVVFLFWQKFLDFKIWLKLAVAFVPMGFVGLFLYRFIRDLFEAKIVVFTLILYGILFIILELLLKNRRAQTQSIESISYQKAFCIGIFQSLAVVPGTSRSGASIFGGLVLGLDRKIATEFSFLLAVPTMIIATGYDTYKNFADFSSNNLAHIVLGVVLAFVFAIVAIKALLKFISKFSYVAFGFYRIAIGCVFWVFIL